MQTCKCCIIGLISACGEPLLSIEHMILTLSLYTCGDAAPALGVACRKLPHALKILHLKFAKDIVALEAYIEELESAMRRNEHIKPQLTALKERTLLQAVVAKPDSTVRHRNFALGLTAMLTSSACQCCK